MACVPFFSQNPVSYNAGMSGAWNRVIIGDKQADICEAPGATRPRLGLLFLHDQDGETLRDNPTSTPLLQAAGLACVCPFGDQAWWSNRICATFDPQVAAERF